FDTEGIHMAWGIIMRHEIMLNYSRIQDIQLQSNVVERWLGLARIEIQTASGSTGSEMTLEGITDHAAMRDFFIPECEVLAINPTRLRRLCLRIRSRRS